MKFSQSGLTDHPLLERAFNASYAQAAQGASLDSAVAKIRQNMKEWHDETLQYYEKTSFDKSDLAKAEKTLDLDLKRYLDQAEDLARKLLEENFSILSLEPAREILNYAENAPPHVLAAALLLPGVTSGADVKKISADFGSETGELVNALRHIKDDPLHERQNLAVASAEVKTVYLSRMTVMLQHEVESTKAIMQRNPREDVSLESGREDKLYALAKEVAGAHPEMDRHFRDAFNQLASLTSSPLRLHVDRVGDLILGRAEELIPQLKKVKPEEKRFSEPPSIDVMD